MSGVDATSRYPESQILRRRDRMIAAVLLSPYVRHTKMEGVTQSPKKRGGHHWHTGQMQHLRCECRIETQHSHTKLRVVLPGLDGSSLDAEARTHQNPKLLTMETRMAIVCRFQHCCQAGTRTHFLMRALPRTLVLKSPRRCTAWSGQHPRPALGSEVHVGVPANSTAFCPTSRGHGLAWNTNIYGQGKAYISDACLQ